MSISIVTAFFDIGRSKWKNREGKPFYRRSTQKYFYRFANLAMLDNEMVIFTNPQFVDKIKKIRAGKPTKVISFDFNNEFQELRERIKSIQSSEKYLELFKEGLNVPEKQIADYSLLTIQKTFFVKYAVDHGLISNNLVAWMDFGYCRKLSFLNGVKKWNYDFNKNKIHVFSFKNYTFEKSILELISKNEEHIAAGFFVADQSKWDLLDRLKNNALYDLMNQGIIDDEQILLLIAYIKSPENFQMHIISEWCPAFKDFHIGSQHFPTDKISKIKILNENIIRKYHALFG